MADLLESKFFRCQTCRKDTLGLIFAPLYITNSEELLDFAERLQPQFKQTECELWVIGPPENEDDEDCDYLTLEVWPIISTPKLIPPSEFNRHIVCMETSHCL